LLRGDSCSTTNILQTDGIFIKMACFAAVKIWSICREDNDKDAQQLEDGSLLSLHTGTMDKEHIKGCQANCSGSPSRSKDF